MAAPIHVSSLVAKKDLTKVIRQTGTTRPKLKNEYHDSIVYLCSFISAGPSIEDDLAYGSLFFSCL